MSVADLRVGIPIYCFFHFHTVFGKKAQRPPPLRDRQTHGKYRIRLQSAKTFECKNSIMASLKNSAKFNKRQ